MQLSSSSLGTILHVVVKLFVNISAPDVILHA